MSPSGYEHYDPEMLHKMQAGFDEAWRNLPADQQTPEAKTAIGKAIFKGAAAGERDPMQLSRYALRSVVESAFHSMRRNLS